MNSFISSSKQFHDYVVTGVGAAVGSRYGGGCRGRWRGTREAPTGRWLLCSAYFPYTVSSGALFVLLRAQITHLKRQENKNTEKDKLPNQKKGEA